MPEALKQYKEGMAADPKLKATYQKRMIEVSDARRTGAPRRPISTPRS